MSLDDWLLRHQPADFVDASDELPAQPPWMRTAALAYNAVGDRVRPWLAAAFSVAVQVMCWGDDEVCVLLMSPGVVVSSLVLGASLSRWLWRRERAYAFRLQCFRAEVKLVHASFSRVASGNIGAMAAAVGDEPELLTPDDYKRKIKELEVKWRIRRRDRRL